MFKSIKDMFSGMGDKMELFSVISDLFSNGFNLNAIIQVAQTFITDENVTAVVREIHLKYEQEAAKLGAGHELQLLLRPDAQRGLVLHFMDCYYINASLPKADFYKTIYLAEITAADIQAFLNGIDTQTAVIEQPTPAHTATTDDLVNEIPVQVTVNGLPADHPNNLQPPAAMSIGGVMAAPEAQPQIPVSASIADNAAAGSDNDKTADNGGEQ